MKNDIDPKVAAYLMRLDEDTRRKEMRKAGIDSFKVHGIGQSNIYKMMAIVFLAFLLSMNYFLYAGVVLAVFFSLLSAIGAFILCALIAIETKEYKL